MKLGTMFSTALKISACMLLLLTFASRVGATIHIITFGGGAFTYVPATLTVTVGDTIEWSGSFSFHPLQDSIIPGGAEAWGPIIDGNTFMYEVKTPGVYWYHCNAHFASGMHGTFTAEPKAGVRSDISNLLGVEQNYPNPFGSATRIPYSLQNASQVVLRVTDLCGKVISLSSFGYQEAGNHELNFEAGSIPNGTYFYQITAGDAVLTREMVLAR
ncbi:MAG: T9SS type A sorting domain-containing protein [Bacteroidota bacterium]|nr:T9SS type A sorting domain-containing protein [Bacteroidota bacterium]MDP4230929.1 T9SS type A sorting domain-containing protein [Bacteroidota bacterium]